PGWTAGIYYKKFKTYTYFGFEAGLGSLENNNKITSSNSEPGFYVDFGAGLYFGNNTIIEIGTGFYAFSARYNDGTYEANMSGSGPYIGGKLGYVFYGRKEYNGLYVGLGYKRVFLGSKYHLDIITLDFGGIVFTTRSGYKYPAFTKALKEIDYEDD
ncbi:hypothetical protein, partial [Hydrogenivirga sp. 128-5-R1-1]|uniref:hypothetical protein n=1 Tax=Hydrogenivirga sp. 128-5-R1-1 TaxID=392423 RepID=UPI00015EFD80